MNPEQQPPVSPENNFERELAESVNKAAANGANPAVIHMVLHGVAGEILSSIKRRSQPESTPSNVEPLPETPAVN